MDFEGAIQLLFSGQQNVEATQRLEQLVASADSWKFCFEHFVNPSSSSQAQFWCLKTVVESAGRGLADADRRFLRMAVLQFFEQSFEARVLDSAVKNKLALLVACLVWHDYTQDWPSALQDLAKFCGNTQFLDFFLRFQGRLHEEVFSDEANVDRLRVRAFKDQMKQSKDMELLCEIWYGALKSGTMPSETLHAMEEAVGWMDFGLLCTPQLVGIAGTYFRSTDENSCMQSANFLQELLDKKGLESRRKMRMVDELSFIQMVLEAIRLDGTIKMREHRAEVLNHLAEALFECYLDFVRCGESEEGRNTWTKLEAILPSVWQCFAHADFEIVDSIEPFVKLLTRHLRDVQAQMDISEFVSKISTLCVQNMRFPSWFSAEDLAINEERHLTFTELRRSLTQIFGQILKVDVDKVLDFLTQAVRLLCESPNPCTSEVECVLYILLYLATQIRMQDAVRDKSAIVEMMRLILESELPKRTRGSVEVQIHLLELYVRCAPILQNRNGGLSLHIQAVLEEIVIAIRGMNAKIAPRAAFLLRQMCKICRIQLAGCALPLAQSLSDVLPRGPYQQQNVLDRANTCYIYEALGYLATSVAEPKPFMTAIVDSSVQHLAALANIADDAFEQDFDHLITFGAHAIEYAASFTVPFTNKARPLASVWEGVVIAILAFVRRFQGRSHLVRDNCVFLCRRMVTIFQDDFASAMDEFFTLLMHPTMPGNVPLSLEDWTKLASLMNIVIIMFNNVQPFLEKQFSTSFPEAVRVYFAAKEDDAENSETQRERVNLLEAILRMLMEAVKSNGQYCATLLCTPVEQRTAVVNVLVAALTHGRTTLNRELALDFLCRVAEHVVRSDQLMVDFPLRVFLKATCNGVCECDLKDARAGHVLGNACVFLRTMCDTRTLSQAVSEQAADVIAKGLVAHFKSSHVAKLLEALEQGLKQKDISAVLRACVEEKNGMS